MCVTWANGNGFIKGIGGGGLAQKNKISLLFYMLLPYVSSFQNGLNGLLTPNGWDFMDDNVKWYITKYIGFPILSKKYLIFTQMSRFLEIGCTNWPKNWYVPSLYGFWELVCRDFWLFNFWPKYGLSNLKFLHFC